MEAFVELGFVALVSLVALLVGFGARRAFGVPPAPSLESCVTALALGFGLIAYWVLLDGLFGFGVPWAGGMFLAAAMGGYGLNDAFHHLRGVIRSALAVRGRGMVLAPLLLPLLFIAVVMALAPPVANDWDSLTYHLAIPKLFLRQGRIFYIPWSDHSNFPLTMEMLYLVGLNVSAVAAKLFHFVMFLLCLATILLIGKTFFSIEAGICGTLLFASVPMALHEATTAYVDLALTAFGLLAFYCLLKWIAPDASRITDHASRITDHASRITDPTPSPSCVYLPFCGVFCGLAMGVKYTGVLIFAVCIGWVALAMLTHRIPKPRTRNLVLSFALALAIASPWYVKNIINTGNPVFPFMYRVFGGRGWTAEMARAYENHQKEFGYDRTPLNLVLSPWRASMWPWNFVLDRPGFNKWSFEVGFDYPARGMIGPALLAFLLPLVFARERPVALRVILGSALALFLAWFFLAQYNRYLFPGAALLSVAAGHSAARMLQRGVLTRIVAATAIVLSALIAGWTLANFHMRSIRCGLGLESRHDFLYRFSLYPVCDLINQSTPEDARVLLFGEHEGFYLDREYMWGNSGHHTLLPYDRLRTASDWWRAMRSLKIDGQEFAITHLLVNFRFLPGDAADWIHEGVRKGLLVPMFEGRIAVFELKK